MEREIKTKIETILTDDAINADWFLIDKLFQLITKEIAEVNGKLITAEIKADLLDCLISTGVDNWGGYSDAIEMHESSLQ